MIVNFRRFAALFALASAPVVAADEWPAYLYDLAHSSFNRTETTLTRSNAGTLEQAWSTKVYAPVVAGATISDGVLYVGEWAGNFYAIDVKTGIPKWWTFVGKAPNPAASNCQQGIGVSAQAVVLGDVVYVPGGDSRVYALNKTTGAEMWRLQLADPKSGS
jgi:outer membrane protein assembly factor BamB